MWPVSHESARNIVNLTGSFQDYPICTKVCHS